MKKYIKLNINSNEYELLVADNETLAQLLRVRRSILPARQQGCELGDCGAVPY